MRLTYAQPQPKITSGFGRFVCGTDRIALPRYHVFCASASRTRDYFPDLCVRVAPNLLFGPMVPRRQGFSFRSSLRLLRPGRGPGLLAISGAQYVAFRLVFDEMAESVFAICSLVRIRSFDRGLADDQELAFVFRMSMTSPNKPAARAELNSGRGNRGDTS